MRKPSMNAWSALMLLLLSSSGCRYIWEGDFDDREQKAQQAALKARWEERRNEMQFQLDLAKIHSEIGRWTIINPTPDAVGNTILLDTKTGETWTRCNVGKDEAVYSPTTGNWGWCGRLQRFTVQTREESEAALAAIRDRWEAQKANAASAPAVKNVPEDTATDSKAATSGKAAVR